MTAMSRDVGDHGDSGALLPANGRLEIRRQRAGRENLAVPGETQSGVLKSTTLNARRDAGLFPSRGCRRRSRLTLSSLSIYTATLAPESIKIRSK